MVKEEEVGIAKEKVEWRGRGVVGEGVGDDRVGRVVVWWIQIGT